MYYLGIDGGGTKTRYLLINENLHVVNDIENGTIHIHQIGKVKLKEELQKNLNKICRDSNIDIKEIKYVFLGIPGYGESKNDIDDIEEVVEDVFGRIDYTIGNDAVAGWAAGTGCNDGINIVAGTGSIAYGRNKFGKDGRCGGWGPGIGDDGSAYWIGLKVINEYTKQKDGRKPKTILIDILEREYEIKDHFEIVDIVFNRLKFSRSEIARFSKIAYLAGKQGCEACKEIFKEAAENLFLHIKVLVKELELNDNFILSFTGGVFKSGDLILKPLEEMLINENIKCTLKEPEIEPWHGAALMAYLLSGNIIPNDYKEKLKINKSETIS